MKVIKSSHINPFGGLNFVLNEFNSLKIDKILSDHLPILPGQSKYSWKDILYSFWSIYFCGGDCIEDLSGNFKHHLKHNRLMNLPSPDRVLDRFKDLSCPKMVLKSPRGKSLHELSANQKMNSLNLKILSSLKTLSGKELTLDYDNTIIFNRKADSANTYKKAYGYCPGVGIIDKNVVYVENRNGNSNPATLQDHTVHRMFKLMNDHDIKISAFRADSGSYLYEVVNLASKNADRLYIKARMSAALARAIGNIDNWKRIECEHETIYRGETRFKPFVRANRGSIKAEDLETFRLVVSKIERNDKQINLFTDEAYIYSAILTNDSDMSADQVVFFYNQRGTIEKEFDVMKNDFGWDNLPFSKLEQNTVFMVFTAICRNLYHYIINKFSNRFENLKANFRIKKFIFRFVTIPRPQDNISSGYMGTYILRPNARKEQFSPQTTLITI